MKWLKRLLHPESKPTESNAPILFTNTLSGRKEIFSPLKAGQVSLYSCGPTVYSKAQIGNLRSYVFSDLIARVLVEGGYKVRQVINITDVGHLVSDNDEGEDKMEVGAAREGVSAKEVAARYTKLFLEDISALNIDVPHILFPRATEYIPEQIKMIKTLEEKGHTYRTPDGIYFDTTTFPSYGMLGNIRETLGKEEAFASIGRRIKENKDKRHPADFALWKFSPAGAKRQQEWDSPWGRGFPGWHIECSAMSKALLGERIDIHTGGIDHIPVHHNDEIAQSESASGKPFVRYWMHNAFITVDSTKISKSLGNDIYLSDATDRGFHPLSLRYLYLQAHYRTPMDFTWEALKASDEALRRLWRLAREIAQESKRIARPSEQSRRMIAILRDDLSTPAALALLWESLRDEELSRNEQWGVIESAEHVLGLSLLNPPFGDFQNPKTPPEAIQSLVRERDEARAARDFSRSDAIRIHIEESGYAVEDGPSGTIVTRRPG